MNVSDSDRMKATLAPLGYENVSDANGADLENSHGREAALCRQSFKVISDG